MDPFNPQQGGGPAGPQNMQNGMIRPPTNVDYQSMAGFAGPPMNPGMGSIPNPAMTQSQHLEDFFNENPHPTKDERLELGESLGM